MSAIFVFSEKNFSGKIPNFIQLLCSSEQNSDETLNELDTGMVQTPPASPPAHSGGSEASSFFIGNFHSDNDDVPLPLLLQRELVTLETPNRVHPLRSDGESDETVSSGGPVLPVRSPLTAEFLDSIALSDVSSTNARRNHLPPVSAWNEYHYAIALDRLSPFFSARIL